MRLLPCIETREDYTMLQNYREILGPDDALLQQTPVRPPIRPSVQFHQQAILCCLPACHGRAAMENDRLTNDMRLMARRIISFIEIDCIKLKFRRFCRVFTSSCCCYLLALFLRANRRRVSVLRRLQIPGRVWTPPERRANLRAAVATLLPRIGVCVGLPACLPD